MCQLMDKIDEMAGVMQKAIEVNWEYTFAWNFFS